MQALDTSESVSVEAIQDKVEDELIGAGYVGIAKSYIRYRQTEADKRKSREKLVNTYRQIFFGDAKDSDLRRDNANIDTDAPMGIMLKLGTEGSKAFLHQYVLPEKFSRMHKDGYVHIHDADFSLITTNCVYIDLKKMLKNGFSTGHGFLREPNSIRAAAALACIVIQSSQNDCYGGQSFNAWDFGLAPYVKKSFDKAYRKNLSRLMALYCDKQASLDALEALDFGATYDCCPSAEIEKLITAWATEYDDVSLSECPSLKRLAATAWENAIIDVEEETKQAMEAAIHNFNTLHSRAGAQCPFSSLNFGMDTSSEGRLVTRMTLEAQDAGLGNGETPIFPITVFQLKAGVNYNEGDPNYDLFKLACKVSAKRLFPNFLSLDAPFNLKYYKPGNYNTYSAAMGCRTRVMSNINGPEETGGRGNFAFTTINLPMLALDAKTKYPDDAGKMMKEFWTLYDKYICMSRDYLQQRYETIAKKHVYNFPFLMGQGEYMGSENLKPGDEIREALKNASISIGFCGLAECLKALTGAHHGESEDAQKLGLKIVGHLRDMTDKFTEEYHMNWSCFGTPAESTAGEFLRITRNKYGVIPGVTDREYFTNSSHCPVYYPIKAIDKIRIEAPYHALENAGCIAYLEVDGDPTKNLPAFEALIRAMHDANMHYFAINHPVDRDPVCGYTGIIENECPHCHRREMGQGSFTTTRKVKI
jgi:ribonucleoside-triphosphate reductase